MSETSTQLPRPQTGEHLRRIADTAPASGDFLGLPRDTDWVAVALYPGLDENWPDAIVSVHRMPAVFYRITSEKAGIDLSTASDMHDLAHTVAEAICAGELGAAGG